MAPFRTTLVLAILLPFPVAFRKKTKFIKLCIKFQRKQVNFCRLSVLFGCCARNQNSAIACILLKFSKAVRALKVNETKLTATNAFIVNLFAIEREKKNHNMTRNFSFGTPREVLTCLFPCSLQTTPIGDFPHYFSFSHFLQLHVAFRKEQSIHEIQH